MVPRMNTADEFFKKYRAALQLGEIDASQASPLNLAYIGDCIYDLAVREYVLTHYAGSLNEACAVGNHGVFHRGKHPHRGRAPYL